eukprot:6175142-Pleurochrysis_carterae.AAC.1
MCDRERDVRAHKACRSAANCKRRPTPLPPEYLPYPTTSAPAPLHPNQANTRTDAHPRRNELHRPSLQHVPPVITLSQHHAPVPSFSIISTHLRASPRISLDLVANVWHRRRGERQDRNVGPAACIRRNSECCNHRGSCTGVARLEEQACAQQSTVLKTSFEVCGDSLTEGGIRMEFVRSSGGHRR